MSGSVFEIGVMVDLQVREEILVDLLDRVEHARERAEQAEGAGHDLVVDRVEVFVVLARVVVARRRAKAGG